MGSLAEVVLSKERLQNYFFFLISRKINNIIDQNRTRNDNHLVRKQTLKHLAKWLSACLRTKWLSVQVPLQSLKLQILHLF